MKRNYLKCVWQMIAIMTLLCMTAVTAFAADKEIEIEGEFYESDKKSHYETEGYSNIQSTVNHNTYGQFSISGEVKSNGTHEGVPSYEVNGNSFNIYYKHDSQLLNATKDEWHLVKDKSKRIGDWEIDTAISKGTVMVLTSPDHIHWHKTLIIPNAFEEVPERTEPIYQATRMELLNGCYYRVIVAYEIGRRTKEIPFISVDQYDYKKRAEIYEFYASSEDRDEQTFDPDKTYSCGKRVRVKKGSGYAEEEAIGKDDLHKGWDLGNFFVSGYTESIPQGDESVVFLKNVGDQVTLWFNLMQDIDCLKGNEKFVVSADEEGYDRYFEQGPMNFGRGALFIRHTDRNNNKSEVIPYIDYLQAHTKANASTKVHMFEEGDYEIGLDYKLTDRHLLDKSGYYKIFFKFSVRNGNCMVYPFELETGSELSNQSMTEYGFRLDLAKSRYLKINLKREVLKEGSDQLTEDIRFNGPAKEGAEYTDEGIYTITVKNEYTGQETVKKIYVGSNNVMRASVKNDMTIPAINDLLAEGAIISESGDIELPETTEEPEATSEPTSEPEATSEPTPEPEEKKENPPATEEPEISVNQEPEVQSETSKTGNPFVAIAVIALAIGAAVICIFRMKHPHT